MNSVYTLVQGALVARIECENLLCHFDGAQFVYVLNERIMKIHSNFLKLLRITYNC